MTAFLHLSIVLQLLHFTVGIPPLPPPSALPVVSFESTAVSIPEGTTADVCLTITGSVSSPITVGLAFGSGTTELSDYTAPNSVIADPGDSRVCATVTAIQDNVDEPDEVFTYVVMGGTGYSTGVPTTTMITITAAPPPPCPCKDRIATLACKVKENNGDYLPMLCRELLGISS